MNTFIIGKFIFQKIEFYSIPDNEKNKIIFGLENSWVEIMFYGRVFMLRNKRPVKIGTYIICQEDNFAYLIRFVDEYKGYVRDKYRHRWFDYEIPRPMIIDKKNSLFSKSSYGPLMI